MTANLATFLRDAAASRPDLALEMAPDDRIELADAVELAGSAAGAMLKAGLAPGARLAMLDANSLEFLVFWMACQHAGFEAALINPQYPPELLAEMLGFLRPTAVASRTGEFGDELPAGVAQIGFADIRGGSLRIDGRAKYGVRAVDLPGFSRDRLDIAGYMHTSGTEGVPKFCAQSHEYYLRLGRYFANSMCLGPADKVLAPLPLFHINPLGYGFLGSITGLSSFTTLPKFSASAFWPTVTQAGTTALVMHGPPIEILKRREGSPQDGHSVRAVFFSDADFLERFGIPVGLSAYGSTEAAGLSHLCHWRRGQRAEHPEGMSRVGGTGRPDLEWQVAEDGEILVRERAPGVLFSGYLQEDGSIEPSRDSNGWFHTGDLGRVDAEGNLVFIERRADSIRIKGEFVPLLYVEGVFAKIREIADLALWRRPGGIDDELVLYVVSKGVPLLAIRQACRSLPPFMAPKWVARIERIPRDDAVGKIQRRHIAQTDVIEWHKL